MQFKLIIPFLLIALMPVMAIGQPSFTASNKDAASLVASKKLAVVKREPSVKKLKHLEKKPDEKQAYEKSINEFNSLMQEVITKEWTYSKDIRFISPSEAEQLKDNKDENTCLLYLTEVSNYKIGDFYSANPQSGFNQPWDLAYHMSENGNTLALAIALASKPRHEVAVSYMPRVGMSRGAITFMVLNLQNQLRDCLEKNITSLGKFKDEIESKRPALKNKTLLIFDPLMSGGMQKAIKKDKMSKIYSYKYEVVPFEKADELIASKNSDYAYIWVLPAAASSNGKTLYYYYIIDAADSRALFFTTQAVVGANGEFDWVHLMKVNKQID